MCSWRAGCGGTRTSGSEGGGGETTGRKAGTAPRRRPLHRKGHRYLLCVVCHDSGRIVWAQPGRSRAVLHAFFDQLGHERCARLEAVSCDMHGAWGEVIRARAPNARVCTDPSHVVRAAAALDALRRRDWQRLRIQDPERAV